MKKKWKKGLALWVAVLALLTLLPMTALAEDAGNFSVTGGVYGTSYTYSSYMLTFLEPGAYTISGTSDGQEKIVVSAPGSTAENPVHITLDGVDIQLDEVRTSGSAFEIASGSHVRLTLSGDNRLTGTADYAGLQAAAGAHLTIDAVDPSDDYSGILLAEGGARGAGIGGSNGQDGGTVTILSGMITARNYNYAAGIGGGYNGDGGGSGGNGGNITISGGELTAVSLGYGAGIGGGSGDSGGTIVISGTADIVARGDDYGSGIGQGAGIGGGSNGDGAAVTITGGSILAIPGAAVTYEYNIGDYYASGQTLHIDGGLNVTLAGSAGTTYTNFQLECGAGVRLTLQDVSIDDSANEDVWPLSFTM